MKYKIQTSVMDLYVNGFNGRHLIVTLSQEGKTFTEKSLQKFIATYSGAGYGFDINECIIEEIK